MAAGMRKAWHDRARKATLLCRMSRTDVVLRRACLKSLALVLPTLLAALLGAGFGWAAQASSTAPTDELAGQFPTLTTAYDAHNLNDEESRRGIPIHLHGVITYFDPNYADGLPATFIHDATGGIFLRMTAKQAEGLFVGALVDVHGISGPGGFGPVVLNPRIRILGRAPLPANPPRVSLAILKTGEEDAQWVEVEGSVHQVQEYANSVTLRLEMLDGPINVTMTKTPGATYSNLVDAQVRIHANAAPTTNSDDQMIGVHLQAPNLAALQVLQPAPSDPFARPYVPVNQLSQWKHFATPMHRVHLRKCNAAMARFLALYSRRNARYLRADNSRYPRCRRRPCRCGRFC